MSVSQQKNHNQTKLRRPTPQHRNPKKVHRLNRLDRPLAGLDCETTGIDYRHGCRPYYVSIYNIDPRTEEDDCWEWLWHVNPFTREPIIPPENLKELQHVIDKLEEEQHIFCIHNSKFDVGMLKSIGIRPPSFDDIEDPLIAHHVLASGESHGLKDSSQLYCGIPDDDEDSLKRQVIDIALPLARSLGWDVRREKVDGVKFHHPHFPTASKWDWKQEMWILRELAKHFDYPEDHPWWNLVKTYGMRDSIRVVGVWSVFRNELTAEGLWPQYRERMDLVTPVAQAQDHGMTLYEDRLTKTNEDFVAKLAVKTEELMARVPDWFDNPGSPKQLARLLYEEWQLPVLLLSKSKKSPGTHKDAVKALKDALDHNCIAYSFLENLEAFRHLKAAVGYMGAYRRGAFRTEHPGRLRLHTDINITGTDTTRLSTSNPSQQNISNQDDYNLRLLFGPLPGREWFSIDQSNVEMRLFAYCSGDKRLIEAFERGEAVHLIFAEVLYPKEFAQCLRDGTPFKDKYKKTLYQWIKNGNFALIYGASEKKANATYRLDGAYSLIKRHLPLVDEFIRKMHGYVESQGYVELLGGYRLQVPKSEPHKASNYFIQGSAGWAIQVAMNRIWRYLKDIPDYKMILQVHDELVFDFPLAEPGVNENIIFHIADLMEKSGDDIGIPLPVEINRHTDSWAVGEHLYHKAAQC